MVCRRSYNIDLNACLTPLNKTLGSVHPLWEEEIINAWFTPLSDIAVLDASLCSTRVVSGLTKCKGVGQKISVNILESYLCDGDFKSKEDMVTRVPGRGDRRYENILLVFCPSAEPTPVAAEPAPAAETMPAAAEPTPAAVPELAEEFVEGGSFFVHNVKSTLTDEVNVELCRKHLEDAGSPSLGAILEFNKSAANNGSPFKNMMLNLGYTLKIHKFENESICVFYKEEHWKLRNSISLNAVYRSEVDGEYGTEYPVFTRPIVFSLFTKKMNGVDTNAPLLFSTFHLTFAERRSLFELDRLTLLFRTLGLCESESIPILAAGDGNGGTRQTDFNPNFLGLLSLLSPTPTMVNTQHVYDVCFTNLRAAGLIPEAKTFRNILSPGQTNIPGYIPRELYKKYTDHFAIVGNVNWLKPMEPGVVPTFLNKLSERKVGERYLFSKEEVVPGP